MFAVILKRRGEEIYRNTKQRRGENEQRKKSGKGNDGKW